MGDGQLVCSRGKGESLGLPAREVWAFEVVEKVDGGNRHIVHERAVFNRRHVGEVGESHAHVAAPVVAQVERRPDPLRGFAGIRPGGADSVFGQDALGRGVAPRRRFHLAISVQVAAAAGKPRGGSGPFVSFGRGHDALGVVDGALVAGEDAPEWLTRGGRLDVEIVPLRFDDEPCVQVHHYRFAGRDPTQVEGPGQRAVHIVALAGIGDLSAIGGTQWAHRDVSDLGWQDDHHGVTYAARRDMSLVTTPVVHGLQIQRPGGPAAQVLRPNHAGCQPTQHGSRPCAQLLRFG